MKPYFPTLIIVLILAFSQISSANKCADLFKNLAKGTQGSKFSTPIQELESLLSQKEFSGKSIIDFLSREPELKKLFGAKAGVWEGYSVREHSLMVYKIFSEQLPYFVKNLKGPSNLNIVRLLKFLIALHDIGKPIAISKAGIHAQHKYTEPILLDMMEQFGFSKPEIKVATTLVKQDVIGDLMKRVISAPKARAKLKVLATSASMTITEFFHLQTFFYTIDAASYPTLRLDSFLETEGKLVLRTKKFQELESLILP